MYYHKQNYLPGNASVRQKTCNKSLIFANNRQIPNVFPHIKMNCDPLMQPFLFVYLPLSSNIIVNQILQPCYLNNSYLSNR